MTEVPSSVRVVVIGGGVMGCSTAYHLAKLGCRDVVLLERHKLTCGTTWHSAAQVRQLRSTRNLTQLIQYSATLYAALEEETGQATGWVRPCSMCMRLSSGPRTAALTSSGPALRTTFTAAVFASVRSRNTKGRSIGSIRKTKHPASASRARHRAAGLRPAVTEAGHRGIDMDHGVNPFLARLRIWSIIFLRARRATFAP